MYRRNSFLATSALAALAIALFACNQVFDLRDTRAIDASFFDAGIDAPFECPAPGVALTFSREFQQTVFQDCADYSVSITTQRAMAECQTDHTYIAEGTIDSPMSPSIGFDAPDTTYHHPHLGPDGDVAVVKVTPSLSPAKWSLFRRGPTGWTFVSDIGPAGANDWVSAPTRGSPLRVFVVGTPNIHELVEDGNGGWTEVATHTIGELGATSINNDSLMISPDGLHLFVTASTTMEAESIYAARSMVAAPFTPGIHVEGLKYIARGFLTEDCGRVYFSTLSSVFYAPRLLP